VACLVVVPVCPAGGRSGSVAGPRRRGVS